ncbi:hypothetical protein AKO1_002147, partial [Acrasis kona]
MAQFEVLVFTLTTVGVSAQPSTDLSDRLRQIDLAMDENHDSNEKSLFKDNLSALCTSIVRLCRNPRNVLAVTEKLVSICESFTPLNDPVPKDKKKKEKSDEQAEDETFDDTIDCYILSVMRQCHESYLKENINKLWEGKVTMSSKVIDFCLDRIVAGRPIAVRYQAAELIGSYSKVQFGKIIPYFFTKLEATGKRKENDNLSFVPYQQVMKYLDWSVQDAEHSQATIQYLQLLKTKLPTVKNGTRELFPHVCSTLNKIFSEVTSCEPSTSITSPGELAHANRRFKEWNQFASNASDSIQFWALFKDLYALCLTFVKISKHFAHMTYTLSNMLIRSPPEFYTTKKPNYVDDLFK